MGLSQDEIHLLEMRRLCTLRAIERDREAFGNLILGFLAGIAAALVAWAAWVLLP